MNKVFKMQPGETRTAAPLNVLGHGIRVLLSGKDTDGGYSVMEDTAPPHSGPPLHRHNREDEWWHILEGEFRFEVDGEMIYAGPGCSVFAARGTAHTFQNISDEPGRMIIVTQPAGLDEFFEDISAATTGMKVPDTAVIVPVFEKHGLELLGPPLGVRDALKATA